MSVCECASVCVCVSECVCECVCVKSRAKERERKERGTKERRSFFSAQTEKTEKRNRMEKNLKSERPVVCM